MPGKRPRAGQIRRTTSMSLFTPTPTPGPGPALFTPSAKICPSSDNHMTHIQEPLGVVEQRSTSLLGGGPDPYMCPPIRNIHRIDPSEEPNEPTPMPTLPISSAKLIFRNHDHDDCNRSSSPHDHFLEVCFLCRKRIGHGRDIFMYRGDSAFCSAECRHRQIVADEKIEKCRSVIGVSATGPVATSDPNETAMAA